MKGIIPALIVLGVVAVAYADPVMIEVNPIMEIQVPVLTSKTIGWFDGPGDPVIGGVVDVAGRFYFRTSDLRLILLSNNFSSIIASVKLEEGAFYSATRGFAGGRIIGTNGGSLWINSVDGRLVNRGWELDPSIQFIVSLDNVLIYRADAPGIRYVVFVVNPDGSVRRMEHEEALAWLPKNVPGVTVTDGVIFYKGNELTRNLNFSQVDDDGNFYSTRTVYQGSKDLGTISSSTDVHGNYLQSFIDNEGNFWAMDFTEDEKQSLVLLYSGRDWGYREPPKKAVTTDSGLRIRLRASTDAFVLGSLGKGEAITILKTGETATIGGITAPWYRIKKADGLIGWAFGGYIKVVE